MLRILFSALPPPDHPLRPGLLLDRDGVINRRNLRGYITAAEDFEFVPGIVPALQNLRSLQWPMIVVSNQAGVAKGLMSRPDLESLTRGFHANLAQQGVHLDAAYYCPHRPEDDCPCRKPKPAMLEAAIRDWRLAREQSVMLGDSLSDIAAARAAGVKAVLLRGNPDIPDHSPELRHCMVADRAEDLPAAVQRCLASPGC